MTKNRIFQVSVALALALVAALAVTIIASSSHALVPSVLSDEAHYQFRLGEHQVGTDITDARYIFRLGEIAQWANTVDSRAEFRSGERALYAQVVSSPLASEAVYQFRLGEQDTRLSPDLRDFSNYQYRKGEWTAQ